jgi:uncharacterized membrane protein YfcA
MSESFLILLSGGITLASAVPDPKTVTLNWLRLAGIIALCIAGLSAYFWWRRGLDFSMPQIVCYATTAAAILAQLAFAQIGARSIQRAFAILAFLAAVYLALRLSPARMRELPVTSLLALAGVSAMSGLALMDMLLGHAYLTASQMTMAPFNRLNLALATTLTLRATLSMIVAIILNAQRPVENLWPWFGLYIMTRWLVGLAVPAVFVYMAQDCINRRSTQSATGILYVAGVLIFIGELIGLYLLRETGLPF